MMCSSFVIGVRRHTCACGLCDEIQSVISSRLARGADSHLVPAEFGDHRSNVFFEFSEVIECSPFVGFTDESCPSHERVVVSADAEQACSTSVVATGVIVDAFSDRVEGHNVASKFS